MRDVLATKEHWDNMIRYMNEEIERSNIRIAKIAAEKGEDFIGVKRGYIRKKSNYMSLLNSLYSSGAPISEIKTLYPSVVETFSKSWTKESGYLYFIRAVSIGIMLGVPLEMIQEFQRLTIENDYNDYILDFLFRGVDPSWNKQHDTFKFAKPYKFLSSVIGAETKEESARLLKEYLEKEWYKGHKGEGWYNSHKNANANFYSGYWSYESGAIAKILKLDDTGWESLKYYPYDMAHYSG
ncbi:MAG: PoNi-like cognate immunity protein [Spirochaetes bacterium]|nr:PoNi-like cognate immunity protein [Spirochaetota bacterium]